MLQEKECCLKLACSAIDTYGYILRPACNKHVTGLSLHCQLHYAALLPPLKEDWRL